MPKVRSELKIAIHEELNKASLELRKDPSNLTACHYYDSINRLMKICEERKSNTRGGNILIPSQNLQKNCIFPLAK